MVEGTEWKLRWISWVANLFAEMTPIFERSQIYSKHFNSLGFKNIATGHIEKPEVWYTVSDFRKEIMTVHVLGLLQLMTYEKYSFNGFTDDLLQEQNIINLIARYYLFEKICNKHIVVIVFALYSLVWNSLIYICRKFLFKGKSHNSMCFCTYI